MPNHGLPNRPYPYKKRHLPDLAEALQRRRDNVYFATIPVAHGVAKQAHVASFSDLGWDWTRVEGATGIHSGGTIQKDRRLDFQATNSFSGTTNPHWKDQIRNGQNACTTASGTHYDYVQPFLSAEVIVTQPVTFSNPWPDTRTVSWYGHVPCAMPASPLPSGADVAETNNRAISKFLDKIDSILSSVELGQDLGEIKETLHGVTKPLHSLRNHTLDYFDQIMNLKRSFKNIPGPGFAAAVADTYLEWTFGWKPLASDIAAGIVALQNKARHYSFVPVKASVKKDYFSGSPIHQTQIDNAALLRYTNDASSVSKYIVCYRGMVRTEFGGRSVPENTLFQADLPHFVPTVWDLIPYSFVVDYFVNVGDVIRSYCIGTVGCVWANKTDLWVHEGTSVHKIDSNANTGWQYVSLRSDSCNSIVTVKTFSRAPVLLSSLHPALRFHVPLSEKPWENMGAILLSRIARIVPLKFK
jgi:hypothetical protein